MYGTNPASTSKPLAGPPLLHPPLLASPSNQGSGRGSGGSTISPSASGRPHVVPNSGTLVNAIFGIVRHSSTVFDGLAPTKSLYGSTSGSGHTGSSSSSHTSSAKRPPVAASVPNARPSGVISVAL